MSLYPSPFRSIVGIHLFSSSTRATRVSSSLPLGIASCRIHCSPSPYCYPFAASPACRIRSSFYPAGRSEVIATSSVTAGSTSVLSPSSEFLFDKTSKKRFVHKSMPSPPSLASSRAVGEWNTVVVSHTASLPLLGLDLCFLVPNTPYDTNPLVKSIVRESHTPALMTIERMRLLLYPSAPAPSPPSSTALPGGKKVAEKRLLSKGMIQSKEDKLKVCPAITVYGMPPCAGTSSAHMLPVASPSSTEGVETSKGSSASSTARSNSPPPLPTATPFMAPDAMSSEKSEASVSEEKEGEQKGLPPTEKEWVILDPSKWSNEEFWKYAKLLRIGDTEVRVYYNRPLVVSVAPLPTPYVGSPLMCVEFKVMFANLSDVSYQWLCEDGNGGRTLLSTSPVFTPTPDLVFKVLILRLSADGQGGMWTEMKTERVKPAEEKMKRWEQTSCALSAPAFRVVTYNVLYDGFCMNSLGRKHIYPFCSKEVLDEKQRAIRLRRELIAYHADLICLQECGKRIFSQFFLPSFRLLGYEGLHMKKNGSIQEGCAVLYRASRFEVLQESTLPLNRETLQTYHPAIATNIKKYKELDEALTRMTAIGVGLRMKDKATGKTFVLGNTHLFYHADGCHIRILQAYMQMHHLYQLASGTLPGSASNTSTTPQEASSTTSGSLSSREPSRGTNETEKENDAAEFSSKRTCEAVMQGEEKVERREKKGTTTVPPATPPASLSSPSPNVPMTTDPILFCGDCNCTHTTGAYRLLTTGQVEEDHVSWEKGTLFWYGCDKKLGTPHEEEEEEDIVDGRDPTVPGSPRRGLAAHASPQRRPLPVRSPLSFPPPPPPPFGEEFYRTELHTLFRMKDAYDHCPSPLPWTNYTRDFKEVIDYIMFSHGSAMVLQAVPIPPEEELCTNCALPNEKYASDHLALVADLQFV